MRVLVTGGTGFIGSNIARHLMEEGHEVVITGKDGEQHLQADVKDDLYDIDWDKLGKFDIIFHEAAINDTTEMDRELMFKENLHASMKLFEFAARTGCKRIVYASSTAAYGDAPAPYKEDMKMNPLNPYGESKMELDKAAMDFAKKHPDMVIVGLRYCNVYGPGEDHKGKRASMIYQLAQQMKKGNPKLFKHGEQKRDHIYVKDLVRANMLAAEAKESCIVNCGFGKATTFNRIFEILNDLMGMDRKVEYIDNPYKDMYQDYTECDMSLAKEKIGFVPKYPPEEGIKDYFESGSL